MVGSINDWLILDAFLGTLYRLNLNDRPAIPYHYDNRWVESTLRQYNPMAGTDGENTEGHR